MKEKLSGKKTILQLDIPGHVLGRVGVRLRVRVRVRD
jgi:hypothetical protein